MEPHHTGGGGPAMNPSDGNQSIKLFDGRPKINVNTVLNQRSKKMI